MIHRKTGRPSAYESHYPEMLLNFFNKNPYFLNKKGKMEASDFPSLSGFAIKLGVHRDTLHEWSKVHPEFSDAYKRAKDFQENYLLVNGNKGLINTTFAIFTAKNVLKWSDNSNLTIKAEAEQMSDEELEKQIKLRLLTLG